MIFLNNFFKQSLDTIMTNISDEFFCLSYNVLQKGEN
mgnify:CR=1 FL=1